MLEEGLAGSILDALAQPLDLALTILMLRNYARVRTAMDGLQPGQDEPDHHYVEWYWEFQRERVAKAKRK